MRGGIARAAQQVLAARAGGLPVLYVDGGDSLFGERELAPVQVAQEELKARALADTMKRMGLAVRTPGALDDARGADFRRALDLPELAPGEVKVLEAGARKVAVVSARGVASLQETSARARAQGAHFVLALVPAPLAAAQQAASALPAASAGGPDLVVATRSETEFSAEENRLVQGSVPVAALQSKGRSLLRVDLAYGPSPTPFNRLRAESDTEREVAALEQRLELLDREIALPGVDPKLKALKQAKRDELTERRQALLTAPPPRTGESDTYSARFVPLEPQLPEDPGTRERVRTYDRQVGELNLTWAREHGQDCAPASAQSLGFVGSEACRECHAQAFPSWEGTKHARAWATLVEVGKQYHLNCVGCHVTGWQQPGGVCRLDVTRGREHVGCESCHGPGSLHVVAKDKASIVGQPGEPLCIGCHNPENSPHFDFPAYLPRVLGPGHGQPAPDAGVGPAAPR
jgi:hypothetical protein